MIKIGQYESSTDPSYQIGDDISEKPGIFMVIGRHADSVNYWRLLDIKMGDNIKETALRYWQISRTIPSNIKDVAWAAIQVKPSECEDVFNDLKENYLISRKLPPLPAGPKRKPGLTMDRLKKRCQKIRAKINIPDRVFRENDIVLDPISHDLKMKLDGLEDLLLDMQYHSFKSQYRRIPFEQIEKKEQKIKDIEADKNHLNFHEYQIKKMKSEVRFAKLIYETDDLDHLPLSEEDPRNEGDILRLKQKRNNLKKEIKRLKTLYDEVETVEFDLIRAYYSKDILDFDLDMNSLYIANYRLKKRITHLNKMNGNGKYSDKIYDLDEKKERLSNIIHDIQNSPLRRKLSVEYLRKINLTFIFEEDTDIINESSIEDHCPDCDI